MTNSGDPDKDGDGIPDTLDSCKNQYGTPSNGCPVPPPNYTTWIIVGIVIAAGAGGAGLAISRSRKSSSGTTSPTIPQSDSTEKGRKCNVCGTIIPEGKNVCPNCGDTYS